MDAGPRTEVRRPADDELCGHVEQRGIRWYALTVFGAVIGDHERREAAVEQVRSDGLASLADRWTLRHPATGDEEIVCIQEANTVEVTLAVGYYSLPGVPIMVVSADQLASGEWELLR